MFNMIEHQESVIKTHNGISPYPMGWQLLEKQSKTKQNKQNQDATNVQHVKELESFP